MCYLTLVFLLGLLLYFVFVSLIVVYPLFFWLRFDTYWLYCFAYVLTFVILVVFYLAFVYYVVLCTYFDVLWL